MRLKNQGFFSDSYQILIAEAKQMDVYWSVRTERATIYTNFTNYDGIDCHVFRYEQGASDRANNATKWFKEKYDDLWAGIK